VLQIGQRHSSIYDVFEHKAYYDVISLCWSWFIEYFKIPQRENI